ncbi:MAG TPA: DNA polymerase III subunit alpha [bacterium]|nr:DNA polymerase III subunit alpha [bacterium]
MKPGFVHLHLHSQFSLLESTVRFEPLMARLKELQMPAVALTDKWNMFGAIGFYQAALSHGIKPLLGCEVWVSSSSRFERTAAPGRAESLYPLVLLAEDEEGYRNLIKLSSASYLQGEFLIPHVDKALLARNAKGLIALSGGESSEVDRYLQKEEAPLALKAAGEYQEIFGKDRFFLEIQDHGKPSDFNVRKGLVDLSQKTGIPLVAANDVRYLKREEAPFHEVLLCLGKGEALSDPKRTSMGSEEYYLKSQEEMARAFQELPDALQRTVEIAERCHLQLEFGRTLMPSFSVPDRALDENGYLEKLCREGLPKRYGARASDESIIARMKEELGVIQRTGFSGYFLIVCDIIAKARAAGIPVGPGRGSAAGSLVAYLIGITDIDPIQYGLLFERFINPERVSAPDIDVDVCDRRRQEVLRYITQAYGQDRVASIATFGTMAAKAVLRDVGRVLEMPLPDVDRIAKLIPFEPKVTLESASERVPELRALAQSTAAYQKLWEVSRALEGQVRHLSTHAAGVIIGNEPLLERVPLCRGTGEELLTQYDMNALKEVGLLKLDILGLRTLTVLDDTLAALKKGRGLSMTLDQIPVDDQATYKLLGEGRTLGVFQLESRGMRDYIRKLEPSELEDLIALLALYRPGPLGSDMVDDFFHRKKGLVKVDYLHPLLEPILRTTYGIILYQEQVMRIAKDMAGFTLGQADLLRRAMGSKDPEKMESMRGKFMAGAKERAIPPDIAESIFNQMAKFAGYGFNKSHSAAYALVAYQTAYLKAHYPAEFLASVLTSESGNQDKVSQYVFEAKRLGVTLAPPHVNESSSEFIVDRQGRIRFSLMAIKNVGTPAIAAIEEARAKDGPFQSLGDFCRRVDLKAFTPKMVDCLIAAGALDGLGPNRAAMKASVEKVFRQAQGIQSDSQKGQTSLFGGGEAAVAEGTPGTPEASPGETLAAEKEVLGFYLSGHPLSEHEWELEHYVTPMDELEELEDGREVRVAGLIRAFTKSVVKKSKELYGRFVLEDLHSHAEVIAWPEVFKKHQGLLAKDRLVALKGRLDRSGERVQLIAQEVIALDDLAVKWARGIRLKLNVVGLDDSLLPKVKEVCERYPGKAKVLFQLQTAHHGTLVVEAGAGLLVKPSQGFLKEIQPLVGEEGVEIEL